jgi:hypothetical protein
MTTFMHVLNEQVTNSKLRIFRSEIPTINFDPGTGPMSIHNFIRNENKNYAQEKLWTGTSTINNLFKRMLHERVLGSRPEYLSGRAVATSRMSFYDDNNNLNNQGRFTGVLPENTEFGLSNNVDAMDIAGAQTSPHFLNYEYDLGFRNIQVGRGQRVFRGVFISKSLPADSDSGEVKMKADDINYEAYNSDRHSKIVTSIEYSVTNKSNPRTEADWIPIQPNNSGDRIQAERLFFGNNGSAFFRFPAARQNDIRVYCNGYLVNSDPAMPIVRIDSADRQSVTGIRLPLELISIADVFTVDYEIYGNQSIINFEDSGFGYSTLASAYDSLGPGQSFQSTQNNRGIQLAIEPYIDYAQIETSSWYASYLQVPLPTVLGFLGPYQPITVVMSNGTVASNQTNYIGRVQNSLALFDEDETAYVQSGRNIVFNRVIDDPFTVYYQYLPSNLKFRTVLRVNDVNYVSPQVNSVQIKSKTRIPDARREL